MKTRFKISRTALVGLGLVLVLAGTALQQLPAGVAAAEPRIAFLRLTAGYWQVWLMNADGSAAKQLTSTPVHKQAVTWCAENKVLHYYTAFGDSTFVDVETGKTRMAGPFVSVAPPPLGPDGAALPPPDIDVRSLLIERGLVADPLPSCGSEARGEILYLRRSADLPEGVAVGMQKTIGADKKTRFEYVRVDLNRPAELVRARADEPEVITDRVVSRYGHVAFVSDRDGGLELFRTELHERAEVRLTNLGVEVERPSWSPDGMWLYFDAPDERDVRQIYRIRVDGSRLSQLTFGRLASKAAAFSEPLARQR